VSPRTLGLKFSPVLGKTPGRLPLFRAKSEGEKKRGGIKLWGPPKQKEFKIS